MCRCPRTLWELTPRDGVNGEEVLLFKTASGSTQTVAQMAAVLYVTKFLEDDASLGRSACASRMSGGVVDVIQILERAQG